jgi:hypothetical protein
MLGFLITWMLLGGVYLLFAGQGSTDELVAAAACGLAGALWAAALGQVATQRFRWTRQALDALVRGVARLASGAAQVAGGLVRALFGRAQSRLVEQPFARGRRDDRTDAAWRAGVVLGRSVAPDSFVVRAPEDRDLLKLHVFGRKASS